MELKHLDEETIKDIRLWRNQPFVRTMMYQQNEITEKEHSEYIQKLKEDNNRGLFVFYLDEEPLGVYQYKIDPLGNYATIGDYLIREEYADLGYGIIMGYFITEINFEILKTHKNFGEVMDFNINVRKYNKRLGVRSEGVLRDHVFLNGSYHDVYLYGTLRAEWDCIKNRIHDLVHEFVMEEDLSDQVWI